MKVEFSNSGFDIALSGAETAVLLEELGDQSAKYQKIRQLHAALTTARHFFGNVAGGYDQVTKDQHNGIVKQKRSVRRAKKKALIGFTSEENRSG